MRAQSEISIFGIVVTEIFLSVLMGAAPIWIAYNLGGMPGLEKELSGLITSKIVIWWSAAMSAIGFLLLALNKLKLKLSDFEEDIWKRLKPVSMEFASGLVGILRVISGLLIGFVLLWIMEDTGNFNIRGGTSFLIFAGCSLFDSVALTWAKQKIS